MTNIRNSLANSPILSKLPPEGLDEAVRLCRLQKFSEDQIIYQKGSSPKTMAMVETGSVRINTINSAGKELTLMIVGPGNWFGDLTFFEELPRLYGAVAHEPTRLIEFHADDFMALLSTYPECYPEVIKHLGLRLSRALLVIEDDALRGIPARVARRLLFVADFTTRKNDQSVSLRLTQEQLGNMLGITRQAVQRAMQTLVQKGLIEFGYGAIRIKSRQELESYIASD